MGISTSKDKQLIITDNDNIEISNLSNQFLFRKEDIGKSKSKCATDSIKKINPSFNCKNLQIKISEESENIFTEEFWNSKTFIINAVDNIKARQYIDNQCTLYNKLLIDTGISGTKAHSQMIIPHITSCYNDNLDVCEMKVGLYDCWVCKPPSNIEYCIKYGRKIFDEYLTYKVNDAKKLLEDRDIFFSELKNEISKRKSDIIFLNSQITRLRFIKEYLSLAEEQNINKVIQFSVNQYYKILGLQKFPRHTEKIKSTIPYSPDNFLAFSFVKNLTIFLSRALSIKGDFSDEYIKQVSSRVLFESWEEDEKKYDKKEDELSSLIKELSVYDDKKVDPDKINPEIFDKNNDNDSNGCVDFIHAYANLMAKYYNIRECDRIKTKMILFNIIPKIITTTSTITGLASLQLYTLYQTNKINFVRDCYLNLGVNSIFMTEPRSVIKMQDKDYDPLLLGPVKAIPLGWTVWDKIIINKSMTCKELIDYINDKYNVEVSIIKSGKVDIIQTFMHSSKTKMGQKIEDIYNSEVKLNDNIKSLNLEISGDIGDATVIMPLFKYIFKK